MSKFSIFKSIGDDMEELTDSTKGKRLSWSSDNGRKSPGSPRSPGAPPTEQVILGLPTSGAAAATPSDKDNAAAGERDWGSTPMSAKTDDTDLSMMSLSDINAELQGIIGKVNAGESFDEKRLDYLIELQKDHPEHQVNMERENQEWMLGVEDFLAESLAKTRSYLPIRISELGSKEKVMEDSGVSEEVAKRLLEKKALWLCRMAGEDIGRIHVVDLVNKYNPLGTNLDIVELAAVFACLPTVFASDSDGKKAAFRDDIIQTLKNMMTERDGGKLAAFRLRNPSYTIGGEAGADAEYGPVDDITSTMVNRRASVRSTAFDVTPRRSFTEVCKRHSILSKWKEGGKYASESEDTGSDSGNEEEEEDGNEKEKKEKAAVPVKRSQNIYVVYSGEDLVDFGWLRRLIHNETTGESIFTPFFVTCTRNDGFLRLFKKEEDVEECAVVNLNMVTACENDDGGGDVGGRTARFVLKDGVKSHVFECDSASVRDAWVKSLLKVVKTK